MITNRPLDQAPIASRYLRRCPCSARLDDLEEKVPIVVSQLPRKPERKHKWWVEELVSQVTSAADECALVSNMTSEEVVSG